MMLVFLWLVHKFVFYFVFYCCFTAIYMYAVFSASCSLAADFIRAFWLNNWFIYLLIDS